MEISVLPLWLSLIHKSVQEDFLQVFALTSLDLGI